MAAPAAGRAAESIRAAIGAAGGAIPLSAYVDLALYGPAGFYTAPAPDGGRAGRRGDFLTSPEVGPLFGAVIARVLDAEWERLGRPDPFTVVDAGAGPGTLARAVLAAQPACAANLRYVAVEVGAAQRERHPDGVESRSDMPDGPFHGVVLANELLDNLPFRLAVYDGGWRESYVVDAGDGTFGEILPVPLEPLPPWLPGRAAHGARAPIQESASGWLAAALASLRAGRVVVIDYCRARTAEMAATPWRTWLRTYRGHERGGSYLAVPGDQDVTVDVAVDQLPEPDAVRSQAQFLQRHGIDELVAEGRAAWRAAAATPDLAALAMRSRVRDADALLDPGGLGGFTVLEWVVD
ncbi:MAG: SAM-dependent methyltransferase [Ilumatobacteraceae bacterium]